MNPDTRGRDERKEGECHTRAMATEMGQLRMVERLTLIMSEPERRWWWWWCSRRVRVRFDKDKSFFFFFFYKPSFSDSVTLNWGSGWMDVFSAGNEYPGVMPLAFLMPWVLSKSWVKGQEYISLRACENGASSLAATHSILGVHVRLFPLTGITVDSLPTITESLLKQIFILYLLSSWLV